MAPTALTFVRASNRVLGSLAPRHTANRARDLFMRPRRASARPWEAEVEARAQRFRLDAGYSALRWRPTGAIRGRIFGMHGWEGRATQLDPLATRLAGLGFETIALDAPAHGQSPEREANPLAFARAMLVADHELGPFEGVVGHSMGGGATALALSWRFRAKRAVLLASPSSIEGVLDRFARFIGLPSVARHAFFETVARDVGFEPTDLDVSRLARRLNIPALVIHDRDDREVPFLDAEHIAASWPGARLLPVEGLGHRRILRDEVTLDATVEFLAREDGAALPEPNLMSDSC